MELKTENLFKFSLASNMPFIDIDLIWRSRL